MPTRQGIFTPHLALDEHLQWIAFPSITANDRSRRILILTVFAIITAISFFAIFVTRGLANQIAWTIFGVIAAIVIYYRRFTVFADAHEAYAVSNKRILRVAHDTLSAITLEELKHIYHEQIGGYYKIQFVSQTNNKIVFKQLLTHQTSSLLLMLDDTQPHLNIRQLDTPNIAPSS